ncbi:MAG: TIGR00730 family Rossman fold protein [Acidimicrobiia bacterium]|nr:TIGR00730 family Rossman fold protein [Acidimicrobiia bacterium]
MKRVCVFCGSSIGSQPVYAEVAVTLGRLLASRGIGLVYGGGNVGLMGVIADAVMAGGGDVIGVIPHALADREIAHPTITQLHVVDSMHERKAMMADLSDAFIAMPGGVGTFEEFFEAVTWTQLGLHRKPCGLLNAGGFYTPLAAFIDQAVSEGFIKPVHRASIVVDDHPERLLDSLAAVKLPDVARWIRRGDT